MLISFACSERLYQAAGFLAIDFAIPARPKKSTRYLCFGAGWKPAPPTANSQPPSDMSDWSDRSDYRPPRSGCPAQAPALPEP